MSLLQDEKSGLFLPNKFVDEKLALKKVIDEYVDQAVYANQCINQPYFLTLHARFDRHNSSEFNISAPVVTYRLPQFISNSLVFWVNNRSSICELLWMVPAKKPSGKLKVEFNQKGVAYLKAKGAMPS